MIDGLKLELPLDSKHLIYLASPYSARKGLSPKAASEDMELNYLSARQMVALLTLDGYKVFSPVVYYHQIAVDYSLPTDAASWADVNFEFLSRSTHLGILIIQGSLKSKGMLQEASWARDMGIPAFFLGFNCVQQFYSSYLMTI